MNQHRAIVLFDAVGTVIEPYPSVEEIYRRLGARHGSRLGRDELRQRISVARKRFFQVGNPPDGDRHLSDDPHDEQVLVSSDSIEFELWRQLVSEVFHEIDTREILFQELWDVFSCPGNWRVFDDVRSCWQQLQDRGIAIGLASNFDTRLLRIAEDLLPDASFVFCSASLGYRKPSRFFYRQIEAELAPALKPDAVILMIGDDYENDCGAPTRAGWNSAWLCRKAESLSAYACSNEDNVFNSLDNVPPWVLRLLGD